MVAGKGLLTADPHTLTVVKALVPSSDAGLFIMNANGTVGIEAGDGAIVSATVNAGEAVASARSRNGDELANYQLPMSATTVAHRDRRQADLTSRRRTCSFANVRGIQSLSVTAVGTGAGTVTSDPAGIDAGRPQRCFPKGSEAMLTATSAPGSASAVGAAMPTVWMAWDHGRGQKLYSDVTSSKVMVYADCDATAHSLNHNLS